MSHEDATVPVASEGGGVTPAPLDVTRNALIQSVGKPLMMKGWTRVQVTPVVNAALVDHGFAPLSEGSIYRILVYAKNVDKISGDKPKRKRLSPRQKKANQQRAESNAARASIRRADALFQYRSMLNAPANKLNNPMIRRAEQVQHLLIELMALDPEVAVTQIPIERCRQWTPESAEWWARFTQLCEERRQREMPDVKPMVYPRREKLDPNPVMPTQEYQLSPNQAIVYSWLKGQVGPKTVNEASEATGVDRSSVNEALNRMDALKMVRRLDQGPPYLFEVIVN